ncbi:hypothetical protein JHU38_03880 [Prevotella sp. A2931]|uniref:Lipoprotein n=1 Tax=Prevotella illustrans TaxID=2800387 RepID=A0ABS3M433_9BACT|nr:MULTISPECIES: hypothetical protein [Prevotella]MBO1362923.1 hypothetical protein [Prevotella illustrans]PTL27171.1 hypothetical protein C3V39_09180 [Prevotella sp. oral taxon 820]
MKKIINSLFVLALAAITFTGCEDVPAPYNMPTDNGGTTPQTETKAEPTGKGTETEPYNVAAAIELIKATEADKNTAPIYVKGTISKIDNVETEKYGNATYEIVDKGMTQKLSIYQSLYLGNKKFTSADQIKVGDEIIIYGPFVNFKGKTPETAGKGATYIYSLNGKVEKPQEIPADDNSIDKPYSVAKSIELITAGKAPTVEVYVKGIISKAPTFYAPAGSLTYYISDDGKTEKELQIFGGLSFNGGKFSGAKDLQVGQTVVVHGIIKAYKNKAGKVINQMDKNNKLITVNGKTELIKGEDTPGDDISGKEITAASLGLGNTKAIATQTLADGTKLIADKGSNEKNDPKYYTAGSGSIRMYAGNTLTFDAGSKKIESIVLTCDTYTDQKTGAKTDYTAEGKATASAGTIALKDLVYTISGINAAKVTITNGNTTTGAKSQLRIVKFVITYAK